MTKLRAVLRRRWPLLVAATVLGVLAGAASSALAPNRDVETFEVEQVLVANTQDGQAPNVTQDGLRITRGEVSDIAAQALGQPDRREELAKRVKVTSEPDSSSISIAVADEDPEFASDVVQAFANSFLKVVNAELRSDDLRRRDQLAERVQEAELRLEEFDDQYSFLSRTDVPPPQTPNIDALFAERQRLSEDVNAAQRTLLDFELSLSDREPYTTLGPERPRQIESLLAVPSSLPFRVVVLGGLGFLLAAALILLIERINRRIDTRDELAELVKAPIVAEIAHLDQDQIPTDPYGRLSLDGAWAEHYRRVRSAIRFVQSDAEEASPTGAAGATTALHPGAVISGHASGHVPRVFMFVSAFPAEGKSTSCILTGMALAETGAETVIVNADFRRPTVEGYLGAQTSPSLADLAELSPHRPTVDEVVQQTGIEHLWLAAAGPPTLEVEGRLHAARELAVEAARRGGTVLIDSSPLRVTNDPIDLLSVVDEVLLVVRAGRSTVKSLEETLAMLDMHHAPVLGVILVGTAPNKEMNSYYGTYLDEAAKPARRGAKSLVPSGLSRDRGRSQAPAPRPAPAPAVPRQAPAARPAPAAGPGPAVNGTQRPSPASVHSGYDTPAQAPPPVGAYAGYGETHRGDYDEPPADRYDDRPAPAGAPTPPPMPPQYQGRGSGQNPFAPRPRS